MWPTKHLVEQILRNAGKPKLHTRIHLCNSMVTSLNSNDSTPFRSENERREILKVAIIGSPNAGKSTVINQIVKRRVFAFSKKVHTTKCCARAVCVKEDKQIVFLDTPGLVSIKEYEKYNLQKSFLGSSEDAIVEADIIGVVHDVSNPYLRNHLDPKVLRLLNIYNRKESFLVLNKIDTIKSKRVLLDISNHLTGGKVRNANNEAEEQGVLSEIVLKNIIKEHGQWKNFVDIFMVSALLGSGTNELREYLFKKTKPGDWLFSSDVYTDQNPVNIIEETVRSKLLEHLPHEIPYKLEIQLEYLDMDKEDLITAVVLVGCNTARLERLIKGMKGERIKVISLEAEQELADTFLTDVHLNVMITSKQSMGKINPA